MKAATLTWESHGEPVYRYIGYFLAAAYAVGQAMHLLHKIGWVP